MLLRQMKYFAEVVDCDSFTQAAEKCYISQSAISQQIQVLEAELGVRLIVREGRRFSLTDAGRVFYNGAKLILDETDNLRQQTLRASRTDSCVLRFGYQRSWGGAEVRHAIAAFSASYPTVQMEVITGTHEELYDGLRKDRLDIVFNDQRRTFSDLYVNDVVTTAYTYAELSARSPLSSQSSVTLDELKRLACILVSSKEQQSCEQDYYQNTLGFGGGFLFAENLEDARILMASGRGFLPIEGAADMPRGGGSISHVPILREGTQIARVYGAFWKKSRDVPALGELSALLKRAFAEK